VKKLISIGVALAVLAMVVLPIGVAAQCPSSNYTYPTTFAKIPFAIIQSGLEMTGDLMGDLGPILAAAGIELPLDLGLLTPILDTVAGWAGGPLSWTVDMLGWGISILSAIVGALPADMGVPVWVGDLLNAVVCSIFTPFDCVVGDPFVPCAP